MCLLCVEGSAMCDETSYKNYQMDFMWLGYAEM